MARRRRTRGTWFPTIGTSIATPDEQGDDVLNGRSFNMSFSGSSGQPVGIFTILTPLTFDQPFEGDFLTQDTDSLSDIIGSEYILQRIVGKIFITRVHDFADGDEQDRAPAFLVGAGFFVARANDESVGGGADTPIGSATEPERRDNYSPLDVDTVREPWIWRRTWILGAGGIPTGAAFDPTLPNVAYNFPASTTGYGSVLDGPHIDSKVKRRVTQDNRLFLAVSATPFPIDSPIPGGAGSQLSVGGYLDYRIFGSLRKAKNSSAF